MSICDPDESKREYSYYNLLQEPDSEGHPVAYIAEKNTTKMLKEMLCTNAAKYSSGMTNFYSRLGGAYLGGTREHNKMRKGIAYMPIYSNQKREDGEGGLIETRDLTGIVIRGPNHTRNPTDRIPICTVERFEINKENLYLVERVGKAILIKLPQENVMYLVRPNSIMKGDCAYLTYTSTALFSPINTLGLLTIENQGISQGCNLMELIQEGIDKSSQWFRERFTEGIVMAAVGNSRDEGYFASLRKIYMVLLSWKRGKLAANWDINSFCKKTNDNLLDNPLSMRFHNTLLELLKHYAQAEQGGTS